MASLKRECRRLGPDSGLRDDFEEIQPVLAREVGDRHQLSFLPEQIVGKARNVAHVDSCAHHPAALAHRAQRRRHQFSGGRIDDGGIERRVGQLVRCPSPHRAEPAGKILRRDVAGSREGIDGPALPACDLGDDVPGRAEAVDAEPLGVARHHQRPPADQAGAQQRRDRNIVAVLAERESIARVGNGVRGEAAVARVAGKERTVAEIFHALPAKPADAAGVSEPGNSDPVADPMRRDVAADEVDAADDFMAGNDWISDAGKFGVDDMKVGPADPTRAHLDANFSVAWAGGPLAPAAGEIRREPTIPSHASVSPQDQ